MAEGTGPHTQGSFPDDSSSESGSGNGSSTLNPSTSSSTQGDPAFPEVNGNGAAAPMDFPATAEEQPINLCEKLPPGTALGTPSYPSDGCGTDGLRSRVKYGVKSTPEVCGLQAVCLWEVGRLEVRSCTLQWSWKRACDLKPGQSLWSLHQMTEGACPK